MSGRIRLVGLAIAVALLANGVANKASAGPGVCKPVKVCGPVTAAPAVPVCKPVRQLPPPEVCKPVKACDGVDTHYKCVVRKDRKARFVSHFRKHNTCQQVYYDAPQSAPSVAPPIPAPAPKPPTA